MENAKKLLGLKNNFMPTTLIKFEKLLIYSVEYKKSCVSYPYKLVEYMTFILKDKSCRTI